MTIDYQAVCAALYHPCGKGHLACCASNPICNCRDKIGHRCACMNAPKYGFFEFSAILAGKYEHTQVWLLSDYERFLNWHIPTEAEFSFPGFCSRIRCTHILHTTQNIRIKDAVHKNTSDLIQTDRLMKIISLYYIGKIIVSHTHISI